ncbi:MAG: gliding motility-associated C-terminal domain-containing protein [Flavobacteriales bacterium]
MLKYFCQLSLTFLTFLPIYAQTPTANINSLPAAVNGAITICQGQIISFASSSTGTAAGATYSWNFGNGLPTTASNPGPHAVVYNTATAGQSVSLTVVNPNGQQSTAVLNVIVQALPSSQITLASSGNGFGTQLISGQTVFKKCTAAGATSTTFNFNTPSYPNVSQSFNWGDGSPAQNQTAIVGGQLSHTFPLGAFVVTHTLTSSNGCQASTQYLVFNGAAPVLSVSGSGQNTCLPFPYEIDVLSNNIPGTNYTVSFTDNSPVVTFSTVNDTTISHVFNTSSCGQSYPVGPLLIENAYSATIIAQNVCGATFATVGPIIISAPSDAAFTYSPASPICQNEPVSFSNTSQSGQMVDGSTCSGNYGHFWKLQESTGYAVTYGNLGSSNGFIGSAYDFASWTNGSDSLVLEFSVPGTYHMWLYTGNGCGMDSTMQLVVINPTGSVVATPLTQDICSGTPFLPILLTSTVPGYTVTWELESAPNVQGFNLTSGSVVNTTTISPLILTNSTNATATVTLSASVGCTNVAPVEIEINVLPTANIQLNPTEQSICSGDQATIAISSNLSNINFAWLVQAPNTISGEGPGAGATINQTLSNSGNSLDTATYIVSVVGYQCPGLPQTASVIVTPTITSNLLSDTTFCPGLLVNLTDYQTIPAGAQLQWTNSNTLIGLATSGNGQIPNFTSTDNNGQSTSATLTIEATYNGCTNDIDTFEILVNTAPSGDEFTNPSSGLNCQFDPIQIGLSNAPLPNTITWIGPGIVGPANTQSIQINLNGIYYYTLTANTTGCSLSDSIFIAAPDIIDITSLTSTNVKCYGGTDGAIQVTATSQSPITYAWTPFVSTSSSAQNLAVGTYAITLTNEDGCQVDTFATLQQPAPLVIDFIGSQISECGEANGFISVQGSGGLGNLQYNWSNGQNGAYLNGIDAGTYILTLSDANQCTTLDTFSIECLPLIEVVAPQFLSPNGDGLNDTWLLQNTAQYPELEVKIFNRWGNLVYEAQPYLNNWNGWSEKGSPEGPLPAATYFYYIDTHKKSQEPLKGYIEIQP